MYLDQAAGTRIVVQYVIALMGIGLIVVGLAFAVKGHAQQGEGTAGSSWVVIKGPPWLILVAIGAGLVVFSAVWDFGGDETTATDGPTSIEDPTGPTRDTDPEPTNPEPADPEPTDPEPTDPEPAPGCRVTIGNPLATIKETPDVFGQDIIEVPAGEYAVLAIENNNFGGLQDQRWFKISVSDRQGWIRDSTFSIDGKSPDCP